jgi:signal transduction histidine kinase
MTEVATATSPHPPPRLRRDPASGVVAGVCAGVGERFGVDALVVRIGFVLASFTGGIGLAAYVVMWAVMPADEGRAVPSRRPTALIVSGTALLVLAAMLSVRELGLWFSDALVWPLLLAASGGALLWHQGGGRGTATADEPVPAPTPEARRADVAAGLYRGGFGVALVVGAALLFLQFNGVLGPLRDVVLGVVVVALALGLILAPFLWRLGRNLADERSERVRSQERAELAAHLHDSVLQTLALVQKRADDPRAVAALARRQERELRSWLWDPAAPAPDQSLAAALRAAAADVEDVHDVAVEVVTVGDAPLDERAGALVAAAREALTNAAKFAGGAGSIDLYAEVADERLQAFVRDRGPGFELAAVPSDRRGVRDSILARMERHGGRAQVRPAPGGGTEVELTMARGPA